MALKALNTNLDPFRHKSEKYKRNVVYARLALIKTR